MYLRVFLDTSGLAKPHMRRCVFLLLLPLAGAIAFLAAAPLALAFSDVPLDHPAYRSIAELQLKHALDGYPDGSFRPDAPTYRAEFAKMLVRVLFLAVDASAAPAFSDMTSGSSGLFPNSFIAAARDAGLLFGTVAGLGDPYGPLSGAQAASMLVRAAQSVPGGLRPVPPDFQGRTAGFTDPPHASDIQLAEVNGLLSHLDLATWDPWAPVSRAQAADLVADLVTCFG
jgi:hypothetical protein